MAFKGIKIRPTYDRVRETLFNILGSSIEGSVFLDLYAGTGNVGLEALSRGANLVVFVDSSAKATDLIRANLAICSFQHERFSLLRQNVFQALTYLKQAEMAFNFIFADPPYQTGLALQTLQECSRVDVLKAESLLVVQHHRKESSGLEHGRLKLIRTKEIGDTVLSFFQKEQP